MPQTIIGKNNILFLGDDASNELQIHCNNLNRVSDASLSRYDYNRNKFFIIVFPDKSVYYKNYLPDAYKSIYRPALNVYKSKFNDKLFDAYEVLENLSDAYYKTDTHINFKGAYSVYLEFIKRVNNIYNLGLIAKQINMSITNNVELSHLNRGIGDLTWPLNLGELKLTEPPTDHYYYSEDIIEFYIRYKINTNSNIRFLDYNLKDNTIKLNDRIVDWNIISEYIIYTTNVNITNKKSIVIFYDSFLVGSLPLYFELFYKVWFVKSVYDIKLISLINPDFVFEFRVERFLC